jgi:hypothetical protein
MLTNISDITADVRLVSTAKTVAITLMMHGGHLLIDHTVYLCHGPSPVDFTYALFGFHVSTSAYHLPFLLSHT